ncbi:hypothetical protein V1290_002200 [Bradyrhizobium sp. AZCC 1578]|uniref:hypothetical protein n=1 Tax=Bradyrhizobium sp. AZCC 1578 TaxID=3117027 RepID=UPI002FEE8197
MRWRIAPVRAAGLLILLCVNAGLLANVATQLASDGSAVADKIDWNVNLTGSVANATNRRAVESYGEILAHPVLFKSREPFVLPPPAPPRVAVTPPPVAADPGLAVGGVMIKNGLSKAYLFSKAGPGGAWAGEGETFQGWKVKSVKSTGVKLEQTGRLIELSLYPPD